MTVDEDDNDDEDTMLKKRKRSEEDEFHIQNLESPTKKLATRKSVSLPVSLNKNKEQVQLDDTRVRDEDDEILQDEEEDDQIEEFRPVQDEDDEKLEDEEEEEKEEDGSNSVMRDEDDSDDDSEEEEEYVFSSILNLSDDEFGKEHHFYTGHFTIKDQELEKFFTQSKRLTSYGKDLLKNGNNFVLRKIVIFHVINGYVFYGFVKFSPDRKFERIQDRKVYFQNLILDEVGDITNKVEELKTKGIEIQDPLKNVHNLEDLEGRKNIPTSWIDKIFEIYDGYEYIFHAEEKEVQKVAEMLKIIRCCDFNEVGSSHLSVDNIRLFDHCYRFSKNPDCALHWIFPLFSKIFFTHSQYHLKKDQPKGLTFEETQRSEHETIEKCIKKGILLVNNHIHGSFSSNSKETPGILHSHSRHYQKKVFPKFVKCFTSSIPIRDHQICLVSEYVYFIIGDDCEYEDYCFCFRFSPNPCGFRIILSCSECFQTGEILGDRECDLHEVPDIVLSPIVTIGFVGRLYRKVQKIFQNLDEKGEKFFFTICFPSSRNLWSSLKNSVLRFKLIPKIHF